ncbi:hypothetical protein ACIPPN_27475 [Streptomyces diastaticus]|uniref:Uncharacterized protein n=2 Tax=Streptomyces diastaticus group TaxID=2849069 RepID=A0ABQ1CQZ4_STRDI|nr:MULTISPECIES: hypothetical protein [Streptomyces diastaticus group]QNE85134.1 hypothetical protein F0345_29095 [Streptomyces rutgersensis]GFH72786.1 hypothetical protein Sdia_35540 [Streptomyces diastaticus subsp. diastaticus]GGU47676.1 hypothetical protein GCM10015534_57700 [Streptomyces diastaticus subsp. diastaticus]
MPYNVQQALNTIAVDDPFTEEDLADLKREIIRDVTATKMLGPAPSPYAPHDQAAAVLTELTAEILRTSDTGFLGRLIDHVDPEGALRFGCLLSIADFTYSAQWWWQYAAGAGSGTAAHCLHLLHLGRGDLRDATHWERQALDLGFVPTCALVPTQRRLAPVTKRSRSALRAAAQRLGKVDLTEAPCGAEQVHTPDQRLTEELPELVSAL